MHNPSDPHDRRTRHTAPLAITPDVSDRIAANSNDDTAKRVYTPIATIASASFTNPARSAPMP